MKTFNKHNTQFNYLITYLIIATTGIHFFSAQRTVKLIIVFFLVFLFIFAKRRIKKSFIIWGVIFISLIIIQQFKYSSVDLFMFLNTLIPRLVIPWLLYLFIGKNFPKYFINIIIFFAIISSLFWVPDNLIPGFHSQISKLPYIMKTDPGINKQFLLYSAVRHVQEIGGVVIRRNPGPFHEPGVFSLFLLVALIFQMIFDKGKITTKSKFLLIIIITTFSTATFLALYVIFAYKILYDLKVHLIFKMTYFLIFILLALQFFINSEFMYGKISRQYEQAMEKSMYERTLGRFYSTRKEFNAIKRAPIFGRGLSKISEVKDETSEIFVRYTFFRTVVEFGLIIFFFYLFHMFRYFRIILKKNNYNIKFSYFIWLALILNLYSQSFMLSPLFIYFVFYSYDHRLKYNRLIKLSK